MNDSIKPWLLSELNRSADSSLATVHRMRSFGSLTFAYEFDFGLRKDASQTSMAHAIHSLLADGLIYRRRGPGGHWMYTTDEEIASRPISYKREKVC